MSAVCVELAPSDREAWHFTIDLAEGWDLSPTEPKEPSTRGGLGVLAVFDEAHGEAQTIVYGAEVRLEVAGAEMLEIVLDELGVEVLSRSRTSCGLAGDSLVALTRSEVDGTSVVSRWSVVRAGSDTGARFLIVEVRCLERRFVHLEASLRAIADSVRFSHETSWPFAGRLKSCARALPGDFVFFYPFGCAFAEVRDDRSRSGLFVAELANAILGAPAGKLTVIASGEAASPDDIIAPWLASLRTRGLELDLGTLEDAPATRWIDRAWSVDGTASGGPIPFDVRVRVGRSRGVFYAFALLAPSWSVWPLASATAARAQDIVFRTLKTEPT
ncbi:MAG: hypothetical protein AB7S26_03455 [Sandaracinaceae bacterium]